MLLYAFTMSSPALLTVAALEPCQGGNWGEGHADYASDIPDEGEEDLTSISYPEQDRASPWRSF